jgi:hypothetical protein
LAEWFKAISLKLIWFNRSHPFESDILCNIFIINGLEPGWLGVSFGLRSCYVRIIITRWQCILIYISNVNDIELIFLYYKYSIGKYIKRLLGIPSYILKRLICVLRDFTHELLEKFNNKRSELKYLSNFRKRNQTRFYD